jgi:dethiobiotin synthetase
VVSAALVHRYRAVPALRYWKPVQTGIEQDDDTREVMRLSGVASDRVLDDGIRLPGPFSPHRSAALAGRPVAVAGLTAVAARQWPADRWVVEGAGGVLVPLNERELLIDLMTVLGLPVIVAARSGLGTINHTLLTVEALRARALPVAGVVMVGPPDEDNRLAIEAHGRVQVVGELPTLSPLTPEGLRAAADGLDPSSNLRSLFS